jgi:hypothetical protein
LKPRSSTPALVDVRSGAIPLIEKISFKDGLITLRRTIESKTELVEVQSGDIVISNINAAKGAIGLNRFDKTLAATIHYTPYEVNSSIADADFIWRFLRSNTFQAILLSNVRGGIKTELNANRLSPIPIQLPSLERQKNAVMKIDAALAVANRVDAESQNLLKNVERLSDAIENELFGQNATTVLADYISLQGGKYFQGDEMSSSGIRLLRNINIAHGDVRWNDVARVPEARAKEMKRFELSEGDIVLSLDRPIIMTGVKVARIQAADIPSLQVYRVSKVRIANSKRLDSEYLFHWFQSSQYKSALDPGKSNGVPHVSPKEILAMPFHAPGLEEQKEIVSKLDALRELTTQVLSAARGNRETSSELVQRITNDAIEEAVAA